jgi:hypothetical protein
MRTLLAICALSIFAFETSAQAPEKLSYQAVIRDSNGQLIANEQIGMRLSIIRGDAINGDVVYVETQMPSSNSNGLVSLKIGAGSVVYGYFSGINWAAGPYHLIREIDPDGGTNYTISGTAELISVPYSLYSTRADYADRVHSNVEYIGISAFTLWASPLPQNPTPTTPTTPIMTSTITWLGDRTIIVNGFVSLDFEFPGTNEEWEPQTGTSNIGINLYYGGQLVQVMKFMGVDVRRNASVTLPINAVVTNSIAGTEQQFSLMGFNHSITDTSIDPFEQTVGPYLIPVKISVVLSSTEL